MVKNNSTINDEYHSEHGDQMAREELLPVILRLKKDKQKLKILEVGCGFGRNLVALSEVPDSSLVGCDIEQIEIDKAKKRLLSKNINDVNFVLQNDPKVLPFADNSFDLIVCWQVLEHVLSFDEKKNLLEEMARVVNNGGYILVETPNVLFPFDYHDTNLPLVHWLFTRKFRRKLINWLRKSDWPASQYTTEMYIKKTLKKTSDVLNVKKATKIYFERSYRDIYKNMSGTRLAFKKLFFVLYFPVFLLLRLFGFSGDLFTPSIRVVYKISKKS